ncbi:S24 family peptidase [Prevotella sp. 10(H)]|uniref:S24 family peptidase n=1 Tax=Prevotella sp. 10(H) TaxID=1158294 RepID=UPI000691729C|nr:S24 family peptidase [Prevotella sp. 10(H)]
MKIDNCGKNKQYLADLNTSLLLPFYEFGLVAGFPSPAANYEGRSIDLNQALLIDADNTRFRPVFDDDLEGNKIYEGDLAVCDTSLSPDDGNNLFAKVHGDILLRAYKKDTYARKVILSATNPKVKDISLSYENSLECLGVVSYTITPHVEKDIFIRDRYEKTIDLNKLLIKHPHYSFLGLIKGDSMKDARILNGDLAVIDKSLPYYTGHKALCRIENKFTIKFLEWDKNKRLWLKPANDDFEPIEVKKDNNRVEVFGIITYTVTPHQIRFDKTI